MKSIKKNAWLAVRFILFGSLHADEKKIRITAELSNFIQQTRFTIGAFWLNCLHACTGSELLCNQVQNGCGESNTNKRTHLLEIQACHEAFRRRLHWRGCERELEQRWKTSWVWRAHSIHGKNREHPSSHCQKCNDFSALNFRYQGMQDFTSNYAAWV